MRLQQLRYISEVARQGLNVSAVAERLHTSQPGVSSQIRLLEEELKVKIFERSGKRLTGITEPGRLIIELAETILSQAQTIRDVGAQYANESSGTLSIATTHTQARYVLPPTIRAFTQRYPGVRLRIQQGNPTQVSRLAAAGEADFVIATEAVHDFTELVALPCYRWNRCVVVPLGHPLLAEQPLTLEALARYPIVTYDFAFTGGTLINKAFEARGLTPNVVLTAIDSDVIKTYVSLGLGIGLLATMAYEPGRDQGLVAIDAAHLFEDSTTSIGLRRGKYLRGYMYDFIELFAPHLSRQVIDAALHGLALRSGAESPRGRHRAT